MHAYTLAMNAAARLGRRGGGGRRLGGGWGCGDGYGAGGGGVRGSWGGFWGSKPVVSSYIRLE